MAGLVNYGSSDEEENEDEMSTELKVMLDCSIVAGCVLISQNSGLGQFSNQHEWRNTWYMIPLSITSGHN